MHVYVMLSGFYCATEPGHDYPHRQAWPYCEQMWEAFGLHRLLWGSEFTSCLDWVSFPQTFGLFEKMPFLDSAKRQLITGTNILQLLEDASGQLT